MGLHDQYGKKVLAKAVGPAFVAGGPATLVDYGDGNVARLDGTINATIAVEIESREPKQVRGATLDLAWHSAGKKLLVLLPVFMEAPRQTARSCRRILRRVAPRAKCEVVVLKGSGSRPAIAADVQKIRSALRKLGFNRRMADKPTVAMSSTQ